MVTRRKKGDRPENDEKRESLEEDIGSFNRIAELPGEVPGQRA